MSVLDTVLRIKGYATSEALAQTSGLDAATVDAWVKAKLDAAHCDVTKMGLRFTLAGRDAADAITNAERNGLNIDALETNYADFEAINGVFKQLVAAWQIRLVDDVETLNDHSDVDYDNALLGRLDTIHGLIMSVLAKLATQLPRLKSYSTRFELALSTLKSGNLRYMAAPVIDSYHTVWFELHEDLIRLSGRNRAHEAAAGRAS